jgi:hypothetical protein
VRFVVGHVGNASAFTHAHQILEAFVYPATARSPIPGIPPRRARHPTNVGHLLLGRLILIPKMRAIVPSLAAHSAMPILIRWKNASLKAYFFRLILVRP